MFDSKARRVFFFFSLVAQKIIKRRLVPQAFVDGRMGVCPYALKQSTENRAREMLCCRVML